MWLSSNAFTDGAEIPQRFTCDGENMSPPLSWGDAPTETRSFVILCEDPDAPRGTWRHWAAYDIPADVTALAPDANRHTEEYGFKQAINDFGRPDYGGPCPPHGDGSHHYHFRLLALSIDRLAIHGAQSCREVERELRRHTIAETGLVGTYER